MKTLFISQDLWDIVEDGYEEQEISKAGKETQEKQQTYKENKKKDAKALFLIQQGVSKNLFPRLLPATTSNESIQVFFTKVSGIVNQIKCYGDTIPDRKIVEKTLRSLPPKYDHVAAAIEESKDLSTLSLHELIGSLEAHEKRINRSTEQSVEQAFQSKSGAADYPNSTKHDIVLFGLGRRPPQGFVPGPGYILTSAQKASRYEDASELPKGLTKVRVAQRTTQTLPSMILSSLGWADAPPQGFVPGPGYILTSAQKASRYEDAKCAI
ncbi:hypothetical protein L3X38_039243 [Prunus dulcis]|uniref:Uncharacterized protein n=1 Tax=Prunus dulcis TaxID=3755 RepID=A0AAD4V6T0_PRUDU|nr:hypothetical protein L3X38_039243 [Prunus dulcis]